MAFDLPHETSSPRIDPIEVYGSQLLRAAEGLRIGVFKFLMVEKADGSKEPVIRSSADNLKALTLADFAIQTIVHPTRYDTSELEDSIDGRN